MFGLRYHVVTVCAMIVMLGLGYMFGASSRFGPDLVKRQTSTIQLLGQKVDGVLTEGEREHLLLRQNRDALARLVPGLVAGKLVGKRIAIIRTGDYSDAVTAAADAISQAGGVVTSTTTVTNRLQMLSDPDRSRILTELKQPDVSLRGDDALTAALRPVGAALRAGVESRPDIQAELDTLGSEGVAEMSGDYSVPVSAVLVVGGVQDAGTAAAATSADASGLSTETALLAALPVGAPGLTVVGCETSDAAVSSMPVFNKAGISTVDCIDLPIGALDLPFAIKADSDPAAYGIKSTAFRLIPLSLENAGSASE